VKNNKKQGRSATPRQIIEVIKKHRTFIVTSHVNLEGDALGSQLALGHLIEKMGKKKVWYVDETPVPETYRFLPKQEKVSTDLSIPRKAEILITVDCPTQERIGEVARYIGDDTLVVTIDHHISNQRFGDLNWVQPKAAATGEMIYTLYKTAGIPIDKTAAMSLYAAIATDTGQFSYSNTTAQTHHVIAELIARGVEPYFISERIYESNSLGSRRLLGKVLDTLDVVHDGKTGYVCVTRQMLQETGCTADDTDGFCNYARSLKGVEVGLLFRETEESRKVKISFRSKGTIDVNQVAGEFGGGGHRAASGCVVDGSLEEVKEKVLASVERTLETTKDKKRKLDY
jgi:phosphoesterase RecJ-like protein